MLLRPHWRCGRSGALQCEDEAEEVEVAVEVTSEEYEPSDGPSGEPDNEPEARDRWRERAPQRGTAGPDLGTDRCRAPNANDRLAKPLVICCDMHGARRHGITLDRSGTAGLRTITDSAPIRAQGASMEEILQIVEADSKDRFQSCPPPEGLGSVLKTRTCHHWQFTEPCCGTILASTVTACVPEAASTFTSPPPSQATCHDRECEVTRKCFYRLMSRRPSLTGCRYMSARTTWR